MLWSHLRVIGGLILVVICHHVMHPPAQLILCLILIALRNAQAGLTLAVNEITQFGAVVAPSIQRILSKVETLPHTSGWSRSRLTTSKGTHLTDLAQI